MNPTLYWTFPCTSLACQDTGTTRTETASTISGSWSKWSSDRSKGLEIETANSNLFRGVQARLISSLAFLLLQCRAQLLTPMISCILLQLTHNSGLLLLLLFLLLFFLFLAFRILTVAYLYLHILNDILIESKYSSNPSHNIHTTAVQLRDDFLRLTTHSGGWDCSSIGINQQICFLLCKMQLATGNLENRRIIQWQYYLIGFTDQSKTFW